MCRHFHIANQAESARWGALDTCIRVAAASTICSGVTYGSHPCSDIALGAALREGVSCSLTDFVLSKCTASDAVKLQSSATLNAEVISLCCAYFTTDLTTDDLTPTCNGVQSHVVLLQSVNVVLYVGSVLNRVVSDSREARLSHPGFITHTWHSTRTHVA